MFGARLLAWRLRNYICTGCFATSSDKKIVERRSSTGSEASEVVRREVDLEKTGQGGKNEKKTALKSIP